MNNYDTKNIVKKIVHFWFRFPLPKITDEIIQKAWRQWNTYFPYHEVSLEEFSKIIYELNEEIVYHENF